MPLRLSDDEFQTLLSEGTEDDLNLLSPEELDHVTKMVKAKDAASALAKHRWMNLQAATATDTFPTPQGNIPFSGSKGIAPDVEQAIGQLGQFPSISQQLGNLASPPMKVAASDPRTDLEVRVPVEEGVLKRVGRQVAGGGATLAGAIEGLVGAPIMAAQAAIQGGPEGQAQASELAAGLVKPFKNITDIVMDPKEAKRNWFGNPIPTAVETGLGVLGARMAMKRLPKGGVPPIEIPPAAIPPVEDLTAVVDAMGYPKNSLLPDLSDPAVAEAQRTRLRASLAKVKGKEKRTDIVTREATTSAVADWRTAGKTYQQTINEIYSKKQLGEIDGPTESRLLREAGKQFSEAVAPPTTYEPPGEGLSPERAAELKNFQARLPLPEPPSASTGLTTPEVHEIAGGGVLENIIAAMGDEQTKQFAATNDFALSALDSYKTLTDTPAVKTFFGTLPQFFKEAWTLPDLYAAFVKKIGAKDDVKVAVAELMDQGFHKILPKDRDRALWGKRMLAENAENLQDPDAPVTGVRLTDVEKARLQDPQFGIATNFYDEYLLPELETWKDPSGIKTSRGGRYWKIVPIRPGAEPPRGTWVVDKEGNSFQWSRAKSEEFRASYGARVGVTRKIKAGSARPAKGVGEYWVIDPKYVFEATLGDRLPKARHNQLIDVVKSYRVSEEEAKAGVTNSGEKVARVAVNPYIEKADTTPVSSEYVAVPQRVADMYNYSVNPWHLPEVPGIAQLNRAQVGLMLASPAEAIVHSTNVLSALYRQQGIGGKYGTFGRIMAQDPTGVARFIFTVAEVADQSGEKLATNIRRLSQHGAVRASQFAGEETGLQRLPGLKQLKKSVFDYPNLSRRSLYGLETRTRAAMLDLLDRYEPDMTDGQKAAIINNEFGTYVQALQPTLVRQMRNIPVFGDPFAGAGVALTKGAFKAVMAGKSGRGHSAEVAWALWAPSVITPIVLNKWLDPQHRWPWQIPGLKAGDVRVYNSNGVTVDIPLRVLNPAAARGMGVLGLRDTLNDIVKGRVTPGLVAENTIRGAMNTMASRVGPLGRSVTVLGSGKAPYFNPDFSILQVAEKSATNQASANALAAGLTLGVARDTLHSFSPEHRAQNLSPTMRVIYRILSTTGQTLRLGPGEDIQAKLEARGPVGRIKDTISDIAKGARSISDPTERMAYINQRMADIPESVRGYAKLQVIKQLRPPKPSRLTPKTVQ